VAAEVAVLAVFTSALTLAVLRLGNAKAGTARGAKILAEVAKLMVEG
jgi:hypothetical protein